jgi:DNA-binding NarL/FixJ family response regulator
MHSNVDMATGKSLGLKSAELLGGSKPADGTSSEALKRLLQADRREGPQMATLKVMLADDHEGFRRILSSFLRTQKGVEVVGEAADGREAVQQAERLHPDLIFMDLHMPNYNGIEAAKTIKERFPFTRVFILSMDASEYHRNAVDVADGFITKQTMKNAVLAILAHERLRNRELAISA